MTASTASPRAAAPTIMVVDGEVLVRHAIADYLRTCGYAVIEAASSDEALAVLAEARLALDAVLCDAAVPGSMGGFALARHIRASRPGIKVVLAGSLRSGAEAAAELCEDGPQLARPYDPQGVVDVIKRLLARAERER